MTDNSLKITYKIYIEADDINQSRIMSTTSYVTNLFANCGNSYFQNVEIDNENDLEDFSLRLYAEKSIEEADCSSKDDAETFLSDMMEFLDTIAHSQSYADLEGTFAMEYQGKCEKFHVTSEGGMDFCDIVKED